jgi:predicted transcriptional regulator
MPIFPILKSKWMIKSDYFSEEQEQTARLSKALAHPVRIAILQLLKYQCLCYHGDMAEELPIAKSTLSQHLKELKIVFTKKTGLKRRNY